MLLEFDGTGGLLSAFLSVLAAWAASCCSRSAIIQVTSLRSSIVLGSFELRQLELARPRGTSVYLDGAFVLEFHEFSNQSC